MTQPYRPHPTEPQDHRHTQITQPRGDEFAHYKRVYQTFSTLAMAFGFAIAGIVILGFGIGVSFFFSTQVDWNRKTVLSVAPIATYIVVAFLLVNAIYTSCQKNIKVIWILFNWVLTLIVAAVPTICLVLLKDFSYDPSSTTVDNKTLLSAGSLILIPFILFVTSISLILFKKNSRIGDIAGFSASFCLLLGIFATLGIFLGFLFRWLWGREQTPTDGKQVFEAMLIGQAFILMVFPAAAIIFNTFAMIQNRKSSLKNTVTTCVANVLNIIFGLLLVLILKGKSSLATGWTGLVALACAATTITSMAFNGKELRYR